MVEAKRCSVGSAADEVVPAAVENAYYLDDAANYVAAWTHVLGPTSVLDVRASFGRFTSEFPRYTDYDFTTDKIGMDKMLNAPTNTKASVPRFELSTLTPLF